MNNGVQPGDELLSFPCDIDVKIFIRNHAETLDALAQFVTDQLSPGALHSWTTRDSPGGNYLAITAVVHAMDREQIDALYQALVDHEQVIMVI